MVPGHCQGLWLLCRPPPLAAAPACQDPYVDGMGLANRKFQVGEVQAESNGEWETSTAA